MVQIKVSQEQTPRESFLNLRHIIEVKAVFFQFIRFLIVACPINSYGI